MTKEAEKAPKGLKALGDAINKKYGKGTIHKLGDSPLQGIKTLSTGSIALDMALGGGYAKGRSVEIYGAESSGKTTLALHAIANIQAEGGEALFIDAEHALDTSYAKDLGVDIDNLNLVQPSDGEMALDIVEMAVNNSAVDIIVIDSVAALVPRAELEGDMGDSKMGLHARLMSQAMRKITGAVAKSNCILVFINQTREKIGVMFGNPETTTGGNALKFYASQRLRISRIGAIKDGLDIVGNRTKVEIKKNKIAPPFRKAEFDITFGIGIDKTAEVLDFGVELDIIQKSGSWFSYDGTKLGQGRLSVIALLNDNPELLEELEIRIRETING